MTDEPEAAPICVLLVEDDALVRESIREHLERRNYRCLDVASGTEALRMLQTDSPDVIVTDIAMPGMNGIEFLLKSRQLGCQLPAILLTAVHDTSLLALGREAGAFCCLPKPPDYARLDAMIQRGLTLSR
ncbi:MAG: response regulator [Terriglobales bacterium]